MRPFNHYTPRSLPEALDMLEGLNGQAHVIAGGTDLMLKIKSGEFVPSTIINIKQIPEIKGFCYDPNTGLKLGSLVTLRELTRSSIIHTHFPVLAQTAHLMASEQVRSIATIGGNLCNAAPSADLAPPLIALESSAVITGMAGEREIPLEDFFLGPGDTVLQNGELLKEIIIPIPRGETLYLKHTQRVYMDIASVGVAVRIVIGGGICKLVRVVLGAVAPIPMRAHRAEAVMSHHLITETRIREAARYAAEECSPIDDVRSSAKYRRRMVEVLTRRGLITLDLKI